MRFSHIRSADTWIYCLLLTTPFAMALSRNIATPILAAVSAYFFFLLIRSYQSAGTLPLQRFNGVRPAFFTVIVLIAFMFASLSWSPIPARGAAASFHFLGNVMMLLVGIAGILGIAKTSQLSRRLPCFSLAIGAIFITAELHLEAPVRSLLGASTENFRFNRSAVALVIFLPFALHALSNWRDRIWLGSVTTALVAVAVFSSESESAKLALIVATISLVATLVLSKYALPVFSWLTVASLLLTPLLTYNVINFIPSFISETISYGTLGIRADMWAEFTKLIWLKPFWGHGMEASYVARDTYKDIVIHDNLLGWAHPHNFAVQVWYELGAIGVALFAALIIMFFRSLKQLPNSAAAPVLATTSAVWIVSLVSHGAWQAWWWSLIGILTLLWVWRISCDRSQASGQQ